jgi:hypothetical protein
MYAHHLPALILANDYEASLLGIERGDPLLLLDSVSFSEDGQPIEYYHALHRGDRSRFEVELVRLHESITKTLDDVASISGASKSLSIDRVYEK